MKIQDLCLYGANRHGTEGSYSIFSSQTAQGRGDSNATGVSGWDGRMPVNNSKEVVYALSAGQD
jgi:hypothetical protein